MRKVWLTEWLERLAACIVGKNYKARNDANGLKLGAFTTTSGNVARKVFAVVAE